MYIENIGVQKSTHRTAQHMYEYVLISSRLMYTYNTNTNELTFEQQKKREQNEEENKNNRKQNENTSTLGWIRSI